MNFTTRNIDNQWQTFATVDGQPNGEPLGTHATEAGALEQIRIMAAVAPLIAHALRVYNTGMAAAEQVAAQRSAFMDETIDAVLAEAKVTR